MSIDSGEVVLHSSTELVAPRPTHKTLRFFGQLIGDRYRIEGLIARGAMGHVYHGTEIDVGRPIAIKVLSVRDANGGDRYQRRFQREASIASRLMHPNIVTVYDYGETRAGDLFMVMERVFGRSLGEVLADEKRIPQLRALNIAIQVARALRRAHRDGAVHRDLKPDNIMALPDEDGLDFVKVLDFGLAKVFAPERSDAEPWSEITRAGMLMGTPAYMPPEQAVGEPVDGRADIYSLGVLFFQMITGEVPFRGASIVEIINMHLMKPPPLAHELSGCHPEISAIIDRCLAKNAADRYASIDELLVQLKMLWRLLTDESFGTDSTFVIRELSENEALHQPTLERAAEPVVEKRKECRLLKWLFF